MVLHPNISFTAKLSTLSGDHETDRNKLRTLVLDEFIKERAGTGSGDDASKYHYVVEHLSSGSNVYLTRPVPLNKGFDFIIHVENEVFSNGKDNPRHEDIINDLKRKLSSKPRIYNNLSELIERVYLCEDPDDLLVEHDFTGFKDSLQADLILKVCKWLFIEQDIRYWNWSGRNMLMNGIRGVR